MARVILTTSIRESAPNSISGRLIVVDTVLHKILRATSGIDAPHRENDINPRGGMRGLRGLGIYKGELAVATFSSILFFDHSWKFLRACTHPSVAAIHEIYFSKDGVWATSTANDLLVCFDHHGELREFHYLREEKKIMKHLSGDRNKPLAHAAIPGEKLDFRKRSYFASDPYDRLHLNSVFLMPNGQLLVSLGLIVGKMFNIQMYIKTAMMRIKVWDAFLAINALLRRLLGLKKTMLSELVIQPAKGSSAIASLKPGGQWDLLFEIPVDRNPSHSIRPLRDGSFVYLLTSFGEIAHIDLYGRIISKTKVTDKFLRGLLVLPNGTLLIGASNSLLFFDLQKKKVLAQIDLSDNELETIFDIQILPIEFDLPPYALQEITGRIKGYTGNDVIWDRAG